MKRREEQAPPLPASEHIGLPRPNTIFQFFILHSSLFTITYSLAAVANARAASPLPYRYLKHRLFPIYQIHSFHFAARRNITPKAHRFPLAENIPRRRRTSLCNCRGSCTWRLLSLAALSGCILRFVDT